MTPLSLLASISGIILGLSGLPQVFKIFRTKKAKDIAPLTYLIVEVGTVIWILYGLELHITSIVIGNALGLFTTTLILVGYHLYGSSKK